MPQTAILVVVNDRGALIDRATQTWVQATGQEVDLHEHRWLAGPTGDVTVVADDWLGREAHRLNGSLVEGGGLLPDFSALSGDDFNPSGLAQPIIDFYERTAEWRLEVWSQWCGFAWPFGWLISALFARRLQQLSLPLRPLDVARGIDSRVVTIVDGQARQLGAAWFRTLRSTGQTVYSGWYGTEQLPSSDRPSVRVVFPLPNGSIAVFLRPSIESDGSLVLTSPLGAFGQDGAYLIVVQPGGQRAWVRRAPLAERFVVGVDEEGILRTDHSLNLWRMTVVRFHYRLEPRHG